MMFKKILIVTDNSYLAQEFKAILDGYNDIFQSYQYAISPFSNLEKFKSEITTNVKVMNLKDSQTISFIIENFDIVFSVHCKQLFPSDLVSKVKCINIHPGFNPINRGWYPQIFSIIHNLPIGATIHEIDEKLDHGSIIARRLVEKNNWDTSEDVYKKVVQMEISLIKENLESILLNDYEAFPPETEGKLFLKKDFNELLEIPLEKQNSNWNLINRLRALSHGNFKNAFFYDPDTGKKIFLKLSLTPEDDDKI